MLRPLNRDRKNCYSTLDIETGKSGAVLDIAIYDGAEVRFFRRWAELINFIQVHIKEKAFRKFIAHFGGSFDYVSLVEYLKSQTKIGCEIIMAQSKIVVLYVHFLSKNDDGKVEPVRVEFIDSGNVFLRTSLADLCDIFKVDHPKLEGVDRGNIEAEKKNDPERYYKYLKLDVVSLYEVCKSFEKYLEIDFFPVTIASLALYLYRRKFQKYLLFKPRKPVDEFISKAYAGGRVEVFRPGRHEFINTYDMNSLYPSVMRENEFPMGTPDACNTWHPEKIGVYHIRFDQADRTIPPLLWEKNNRNGLEFVYSGEGHFCDPEIRLALENGVEVEVISGYVWTQSAYIFREFVDVYYNLRMANHGNAVGYICKILLNSLYGKFGQKENKSVLCKIPNYEDVKALIDDPAVTVKDYQIESALYEITTNRPTQHRIIYLSARITSLARVALNREIINHAGTVVYCDTDSVHLTKDMDPEKISPDKLGAWKKEDTGSAVYLGRKQYIIGNKMRFKGIQLVDKLDENKVILCAEDFDLLDRGLAIEKKYHFFPKVKSVIAGRAACKIYPGVKVLKKSEYFSNFIPSENTVSYQPTSINYLYFNSPCGSPSALRPMARCGES